jgi:hypothetical protein
MNLPLHVQGDRGGLRIAARISLFDQLAVMARIFTAVGDHATDSHALTASKPILKGCLAEMSFLFLILYVQGDVGGQQLLLSTSNQLPKRCSGNRITSIDAAPFLFRVYGALSKLSLFQAPKSARAPYPM